MADSKMIKERRKQKRTTFKEQRGNGAMFHFKVNLLFCKMNLFRYTLIYRTEIECWELF